MRGLPYLAGLLCIAPLLCFGSAPTYTVQTLAYPGALETVASGVNSAGVVVGYYIDTGGLAHGFVWDQGNFSVLNITGIPGTWITGINSTSTVCGYLHAPVGETIGFVLTGTKLTQFAAPSGGRETFPAGINDSGVLAGYSESGTLAEGVYDGFTAASATATSVAVTVAGQTNTWVGGINNHSDVVGYAGANLDPTTPVEAFVYDKTTNVYTIENMPGMVQTRFYAINALNDVVGYALDSSQAIHSFLFRSGTYEDFVIPGYTTAIPLGLTEAGVVVGYAVSSTNTLVGFIATP